ncbi:MAG TPA: hypothetical protein PKM63_01510 [Panacibacter sp.]|nr:hypothetical protein [Panacibacter sp.]HNP42932.1 hypothetical protein [Panacibacter sp.]
MKTIRIGMASLAVIATAILGCSKADLTAPRPSIETASFASESVAAPNAVCGTPVVYNLIDSKKVPQGTITISNDATNVFVTFTSTNANLKFQKATLVVGDLAHVSAATNLTVWPKVATGPSAPDFSMTFKPEVSTYTFTIPAANYSDCFLVNAFGKMVQRDANNKIIATDYVFFDSKTEVSTKCWSSYVEYCKQACPPPCGQLTTYTQGGYGNDKGNGAGTSYMIANFAAAFPNGVTIGDAAGYTLKMTNANSVALYLPTGATPAALTQSYVDAGPNNILAGQVLTLALSVGFDNYDPNFGAGQNHLADMVIGSGTFQGKTVSQFLTIANAVLGGTSNAYTAAEVNSAADSINNNYDNGTQDLGFLTCPN